MKMLQKKFALILCVVLAISMLASCGKTKPNQQTNKPSENDKIELQETESEVTEGLSTEIISTEEVSTEEITTETTESESEVPSGGENISNETPAPSETPSGSNKGETNNNTNHNQQSQELSAGEKMAKDIVNQIIKPGMSEFEKAITIHDWLTFNIDYDLTYTHYYVEETLRDRTGVCQGYALSFQAMAEQAGLTSVYIVGSADNGSGDGYQGHAWNRVRIDGAWYNVDTTWDDPVYAGKDPSNHDQNGYGYFLVSDSTLNKDHRVEMIRGEAGNANSDYDRKTIIRHAVKSGLYGDVTYFDTIEEAISIISQKRNENCTSFNLWNYIPSVTAEQAWNNWNTIINRLEYSGVEGNMLVNPNTGMSKYIVNITISKETWDAVPVVHNATEFETLANEMKGKGIYEFEVRYESGDGTWDIGNVGLSECSYYEYYGGKSHYLKVKLWQG